MENEINKTYYNNGKLMKKQYLLDGKLHREDGPAEIKYYKSGNIWYKKYYINNELHKDDGPACIYYHENGLIMRKQYFIEKHNLTVRYEKYKNRLTKEMIKCESGIYNLKLMKLICIESNNTELLESIDCKIVMVQLSEHK